MKISSKIDGPEHGPDLSPELVPDEVLLQPDDYELPEFVQTYARGYAQRRKLPIKITREQIIFFGERGVPWTEIEKFYGVERRAIMRYYSMDYEKGVANVNVSLRNKMVEIALKGHPTMLIWLGKNRLRMSDAGPVDPLTATSPSIAALNEDELNKLLDDLGYTKKAK